MLGDINLSRIFKDLDDHMTDTAVNENHVFGLIKLIANHYSKVRLYHLGKLHTERIAGERVRKRMAKMILFKHQ